MKRNPARAALAEAILTRNQLAQYIATAEEARDDAVFRWARASRELEEIERSERDAANIGHSILAAMSHGDFAAVATIVREDSAEARKRELKAEISTWARAKMEIRATVDEYKQSLESARREVERRAREVVSGDEVFARLRDGLAEQVDDVARRLQALRFLSQGADAAKRSELFEVIARAEAALGPRHFYAPEWAAAMEALAHDADAPLPV